MSINRAPLVAIRPRLEGGQAIIDDHMCHRQGGL